ncbi:cysteine synthase A [Thermosporothrix hazakensis]|jgi:cysteine synthase A|uniref:cysteine synthase n=2 Tax=Thermosporothrix TaxID=768650 RepID=A0A326U104_THEHA|nr:cysteine synthase A [Thermosporothrix hazakensis]PZW24179.1 cysteine synthase A [Thermosporothrix hazakensis]BBH89625.1 cysteine synthase [Thermosporothrix sp. COM3]GCE47811.1 cysteine synthase [Thermosporothrix hazakensis]
MTSWAKNATELIGRTPLIELQRFSAAAGGTPATLLAKLEMYSPGGSSKDRVAYSMIREAEEQGKLRPGSTIVEPTSGNMGISLAWIAAARGYRCILTMPDTIPLERRMLLQRFNAQIMLTPANQGMRGAINKVIELRTSLPNVWYPQQFYNQANPRAHRETTAVEIWEDTGGRVDMIVIGVGTGGTLTGLAEGLRERNPGLEVVAVEPASCAVLSGGRPGPNRIEGLGAGFIPDTLRLDLIDRVTKVTDQDAVSTAIAIMKEEGLSVGLSSGAVAWAALQEAKKEENKDKVIVTVFPSGAERYLQTVLFEDLRHKLRQQGGTKR